MSNFNLISPEGNGFNFNVRFDEPIIVPENASVHMNWCQFERDNLINFTEAQTIKITPTKILPYYDWYNNSNGKVDGSYRVNGLERTEGDLTFTIPKGRFSLAELQTKICRSLGQTGKAITQTITETRDGIPALFPMNNPSLNLSNYSTIVPTFVNDPTNLAIGVIKRRDLKAEPTFDPTHGVGMDQTDPATGDGGFTKKASATAGTPFTNGLPNDNTYDAYWMGRDKYNHIGGHFNQYIGGGALSGNQLKNGGFDELQNVNTINFLSNKNFDETSGSIFLGLYVKGYAGADGDASVVGSLTDDPLANRIQTNNMKDAQAKDGTGGFYPKCHFGVEYTGHNPASLTDGEDSKLNIIMGELDDPTDMNDTLEGMSRIAQIDITKYRDPADTSPFSFGFQTYYDKGNSNQKYTHASDGDLHIRVYIQVNDGHSVVVYDSNTKYPHSDPINSNTHFFKEFMETFNNSTTYPADTINLAQAQSSIPFVPICCATHQGEGGTIRYDLVDEIAVQTASSTTTSLLVDYQMEFSNELGNLIQPLGHNSTYTSQKYSPSYIDYDGANNFLHNEIGNLDVLKLAQNSFYFLDNYLIGQYRQDKFSVVLNNLPIKSYKNTNDKSKSGYRKPVLANIPNPFSGADTNMGNGGKVLGSYQSSLGIVNRLSNQAITTNNFDVLVLDLETDKPAEQLTKSIINFTITAD